MDNILDKYIKELESDFEKLSKDKLVNPITLSAIVDRITLYKSARQGQINM